MRVKNAHIAIFNVPRPVHVHPTLSFASTLVRRGCRVTYVTSKGYETEIKEFGAEVLLCPRLGRAPEHANIECDSEGPYSEDLAGLASETLSRVAEFYKRNRPDLIVYDTLASAALIVADRLAVPTVRMTSHLADDEENPLYRKSSPTFEKVDRFLQENGLRCHDEIFNRNEPVIYFYTRDLQVSRREIAGDTLYAARCSAERPCRDVWRSTRIERNKAVLVSASTAYTQSPEYYQMCMQALSELDRHGILAIGAGNDSEIFHPLPPGCEVTQRIPQIAIMPHVNLLICTGGMATTTEAMYHGLPMIMLTHGNAQMERYAENVQSHRLGIHIKGEATIASIKRAVEQIAKESSMLCSIKEMQGAVRCGAGGEEVANWLEVMLQRGPY